MFHETIFIGCHSERSEEPLICWWITLSNLRDCSRNCEVPRRLRGSGLSMRSQKRDVRSNRFKFALSLHTSHQSLLTNPAPLPVVVQSSPRREARRTKSRASTPLPGDRRAQAQFFSGRIFLRTQQAPHALRVR